MVGRTDYEISGRHTLTAYMGCLEMATESCYRESTYAITTTDGGLTWKKGARTSRQLSACASGHRIEYGAIPSTVRIDSRTIVSTFRSGYTPARGSRTGWIDVSRSTNNGFSWEILNGRLMELPTLNSSPPALSRLPSGRLVCSWGYRLPDDGSGSTAIHARLSDDNGCTWGKTLVLRRDGFDYDIGYNRQVVRPDGKIARFITGAPSKTGRAQLTSPRPSGRRRILRPNNLSVLIRYRWVCGVGSSEGLWCLSPRSRPRGPARISPRSSNVSD